MEGIDYGETFAPTRKPEKIRLFFSVAAKENFILRQMVVKSAFLHPISKGDFFLEKPQGFKKPDQNRKTCLQIEQINLRSERGSQNWHEDLETSSSNRTSQGAKKLLFFSKNENHQKLYVICWVADLTIAVSKVHGIEELKKL